MIAGRLQRSHLIGSIRNLAPGVRNRFIVTPHDLRQQLPFVLLVEDFIEPGSDFHPHAHAGLETVTFVLSGYLRHADHLGTTGILDPDDVQWMTAGGGIEHGGEPVGGSVHSLQLWIALPAAFRNSAPGTRTQQRRQSSITAFEGGSVAIYGVTAAAHQPWSRWPLRVIDIQLDAGAKGEVELGAGERVFFYVLDGAVTVGGARSEAGNVLWIADDGEDRLFSVVATKASRIVGYASPSFDEPIVANGAFVAGSMTEIERFERERVARAKRFTVTGE